MYWGLNTLLYILNIEFFYEIYKTKIMINIYTYMLLNFNFKNFKKIEKKGRKEILKILNLLHSSSG